MRNLWVVSFLILLGGRAWADDAGEARAHYQKATNHFAVGEFSLAADEYQEAYKLKPDPALLFNAAQARRIAGENEKALVLYKNYLQFHPKAKNIAEVHEQIAKLQEAIAAAEKAKTAPPQTTVEPAPQTPPPATTTPPPPEPQQQAVTTPPPDKPKDQPTPIYKKWWLWTAVGVVVVAAVVIPIAVIESSPAKFTNIPDQGPGVQAVTVRW